MNTKDQQVNINKIISLPLPKTSNNIGCFARAAKTSTVGKPTLSRKMEKKIGQMKGQTKYTCVRDTNLHARLAVYHKAVCRYPQCEAHWEQCARAGWNRRHLDDQLVRNNSRKMIHPPSQVHIAASPQARCTTEHREATTCSTVVTLMSRMCCW